MFNVLFKTIVTFLAVYALIDIAVKFINYKFCPKPYTNEDVFVVLRVCNQEENLERIVRNLIWKNLTLSNGGYIPNIVIVDMGSQDCTRVIGERLSEDYTFIYYMSYEDYDKIKDTFMF